VAPNLLDACETLWTRLAGQSGVSATYTQGNQSITLTVVPGLRKTRTENSDGSLTTVKDTDFIIRAADLVISGSMVVPLRRDRISYADANGVSRKFELVGPFGGRHYDPSDQYGVMLRLHAVEVIQA
jgi:hypothetical protein